MNREWIDLLRMEKTHVWDEEGWFVPLAAALDGLTAAQAAWQPPGGGNTIWQTLAHLNFYNERYLVRVTGGTPGAGVADNDATFAPGDPADEAAWQSEVARARRLGEGWSRALAELTNADVERKLGDYFLGDQLAHLMLHLAYHTGQIVLLRKQQGSWAPSRVPA